MEECEDLAAFKATMFIAPYGKQPLEKNWHVVIPKKRVLLCFANL